MTAIVRALCIGAVVLASAQATVAQDAAPTLTGADETYDLLFRNGTLDDLPREGLLIYDRNVTNTLVAEAGPRDTGQIELSFQGGEPEVAGLRLLQDGRHRGLGQFPASVGNPVIMYFVETVVRDMAEAAGGSPFYIRNRVKAALVEPAEIEMRAVEVDGETVEARAVTLRPFDGDPNADRMRGFDALELTVVMSDAVPGWYRSLAAFVPGGEGQQPVYDSTLVLDLDG